MRKPKFTPGPWLSYKLQDDDVINITTRSRKEGHFVDVAFISVGFDKPFDDEQRANAHLISAAPELYAALEEYFKCCYKFRVYGRRSSSCRGCGELKTCLVRKAIKKARGESNPVKKNGGPK